MGWKCVTNEKKINSNSKSLVKITRSKAMIKFSCVLLSWLAATRDSHWFVGLAKWAMELCDMNTQEQLSVSLTGQHKPVFVCCVSGWFWWQPPKTRHRNGLVSTEGCFSACCLCQMQSTEQHTVLLIGFKTWPHLTSALFSLVLCCMDLKKCIALYGEVLPSLI